MKKPRIYDDELYAHFVTFSCYHRRRFLDHDKSKKIVIGVLCSLLNKQSARCLGFVIMPDHIHAILWFAEPNQLSRFMKQWKQQASAKIKSFFKTQLPAYCEQFEANSPIWQRKFYAFHLYSEEKITEKLNYIHLNPVRAGIVKRAIDWQWSSARWYELGKSVGVPIDWVS